mmetsp:Transcript_15726/g.29850  ORF Transcript_15726/g.29850 Transcript_15726/m.29850 type:complete len:91 (+) Transcript_15726:179-451(+)
MHVSSAQPPPEKQATATEFEDNPRDSHELASESPGDCVADEAEYPKVESSQVSVDGEEETGQEPERWETISQSSQRTPEVSMQPDPRFCP